MQISKFSIILITMQLIILQFSFPLLSVIDLYTITYIYGVVYNKVTCHVNTPILIIDEFKRLIYTIFGFRYILLKSVCIQSCSVPNSLLFQPLT